MCFLNMNFFLLEHLLYEAKRIYSFHYNNSYIEWENIVFLGSKNTIQLVGNILLHNNAAMCLRSIVVKKKRL